MTDIDMPAAMERAADFIEVPGNFGKLLFKKGDCYCTLGAFALSLGAVFNADGSMDFPMGAFGVFNEGWSHLSETVRLISGRRFQVVQGMNDRPETTAEQMANVLRETAKRLRTESD